MTSPRWPRVLDMLALLLVFNISVAPVAEALPEPGPPAPVVVMEQPFTPGQGDIEPTIAKERVKEARVTTYSSDEWEQELRHQDWQEQAATVRKHIEEAIKDAEHVAYLTGRGPLIVQRPYNYADSKSAATYN